MKKLLTFALTGALLTGCLYDYNSNKPLTGQIPSTDKTKLEGTKLSSRKMEPAADGTYAVWQRLYDTTWYQTEKEIDDGRLDVETEFVFFNSDSSVFEVEVENGRAERPDRDDYAVLTPIRAIQTVTIRMLGLSASLTEKENWNMKRTGSIKKIFFISQKEIMNLKSKNK